MTLENYGLLDNLDRYKYAVVADLAMKNRDEMSARKSLEHLAMDMGVNTTSDAESVSISILRSQDIETYLGKYQNALNETTVNTLFTRYGSSLSKIVGDNQDNLLRDFGNETYHDIELKVNDAMEKKQSKGNNFSEEQKKEAEEILKKYSLIYSLLKKIESEKMQELFSSVNDETLKEGIDEYYKKKEEDKPE